jgi:hypothetical protein
MAITNYDGIISSRSASADDPFFYKTGTVGGVTANWYSFIKSAGSPTSATTYAAATAGGSLMYATCVGAIPLQAPGNGQTKYLLTFGGMIPTGPEISALALVDVLWAGGGCQSSEATGARNVNSPALTRSTNGLGNTLGVMVATALGTTVSTFTINYTDGDDATQHIDITLTTAAAANRMLPIGNLVAGATPRGVKSIQSINNQATVGAGAVDVFIMRVLTVIPTIGANVWVERDMTAQIDGILPIGTTVSNPFLTVAAFTNGTTARGMQGMLRTAAG